MAPTRHRVWRVVQHLQRELGLTRASTASAPPVLLSGFASRLLASWVRSSAPPSLHPHQYRTGPYRHRCAGHRISTMVRSKQQGISDIKLHPVPVLAGGRFANRCSYDLGGRSVNHFCTRP